MADDKMFVREVDQLMNVIGFVEIGRYYYETELLSTQLPSRSQVSHWQYYKLTRNSVNQLSALKIYQRGKGRKVLSVGETLNGQNVLLIPVIRGH